MQSERTENLQQWIEENGYLVNPTPTVLRELADSLATDGGTVRVLTEKSTLRSFDREFTPATRLAELEREGTVEFRELDRTYQSNLVVTETVTGAFLDLDEVTAAVGTEDEDLTDAVTPVVEQLWDEASVTYLRTPPQNKVESAFNELLNPTVYDAFKQAVGAMEEAARLDEGANDVSFGDRRHTYASLLIAGAKNEVSLRELGRCAEHCELASRSTLSRVKQELEEVGFITTSPMETDVGRPPMKLQVNGLYVSEDTAMLAERVYDDLYGDSESKSLVENSNGDNQNGAASDNGTESKSDDEEDTSVEEDSRPGTRNSS